MKVEINKGINKDNSNPLDLNKTWTHRIVWVEGNLTDYLVPTPALGRAKQEQEGSCVQDAGVAVEYVNISCHPHHAGSGSPFP